MELKEVGKTVVQWRTMSRVEVLSIRRLQASCSSTRGRKEGMRRVLTGSFAAAPLGCYAATRPGSFRDLELISGGQYESNHDTVESDDICPQAFNVPRVGERK